MTQGSFLAELKRRNVIRAAGLYLVGAWLAVQVASTVLPMFDAPAWLPRSIVVALAIGFLPAMIFSWAFELTPDGLKRESEIQAHESISPRTGRHMDRAIMVVLAVALAYFGFDKFVLAPRRDAALVVAAEKSAGVPTQPVAADAQSIAVLPLSNESGDQGQQYFSDGLSENLIVALSQFSGLKVIGRNSSFRFRDSKDDSKTIGAKLGVATLLEGSVQRAGDAVRISAELIRATDGVTLWSQNYDRSYKDLFALQDEITQAVAGALKAKLLANGAAAVQTDRPPGGNLDAYNAYLQGNYYTARGSEDDYRRAIAEYAIATRIDPRYAQAWAAAAHAGNWLASSYLSGTQARQAFAQTRLAADTALKLDPNLAAAHSARGELLSTVDFDWDGSEAELRRALQLDPGNEVARENLGVLYASHGQPEQAIDATRQSLVTDPMRASGYFLLSRYLTALGRMDEAEQAVRKVIELQTASPQYAARLVEIEIQRGDPKAALDTAQKTAPGIWQDYALAMARQVGGDRAAADAALKTAIDKDADGMAFQIAEVYALRRDASQTFAWLDRAFTNRDPGLQFLLVNPFILRYRDDPRFVAFCRKLGVPTTTAAQAMP